MSRLTFLLTAGSLLGGVLLLAGCSSTTATGDHADAQMRAMACPQCETVWVAQPSAEGPRHVTRLSRTGKMVCPGCEAMAKNQLTKDGMVMLHNCPTCKVVPDLLTPQDSPQRDLPR